MKFIKRFRAVMGHLFLLCYFMNNIKFCYPQIVEDTGQIFIEISDIISSMPSDSGNDYNDPDESELNSWTNLMDELLAGYYNQANLTAGMLGYDVIHFTDTTESVSKSYYIIKTNGSNYWGTYVYNPNYCRPLVIQIPHPIKEINTGQQGIHVFRKTDALFFCLSGTSRCNNLTYSSCDGTTTICSGNAERYRISDMAHNVSSVFQKTTEMLLNSFSNTFFIQLHGFTKLASDPYLILSNGTQITPLHDYVVPLKDNLLAEDNSLTFKIAHIDLTWTRLRAFDNTQGRLINSSIDPCNANATMTNGRFLSIEQERTKLRDNETGWNKMANALINTFVSYPFQWVGSCNTDWNTAANWRNYIVPSSSDNVTIIHANQYPVINNGPETPALCNNLEIQSSTILSINPGKAITVSGTLTNYGSLTIKSNDAGTGSLICSTTGVNANVERFLTKMKWHFIGMPVESAVAGVFHLPGGHSDIWLMPYIESANSWGETIVPVDSALILGKGYACWVGDNNYSNDEKIVFSGILNAGDYTTGSGGYERLTYTGGGYNFISNPYPSALQGNIHTWTKSNVDNSIWVWQGTGTTMAGGGNYLTWNGTTGSLTDGIIPAMQGFFVHANSADALMTLPQCSRTHNNQSYYKDSGLSMNTLRLDVTGNECFDAIFVGFINQATEGYDSEYDVVKMHGINQAPQLYSLIPGNELSINILPEVGDNRTIPLGFECGLPSTFKIEASGMEGFDQLIELYLEDLKVESIQNLRENPVCVFTSELGDASERFLLHFRNPNAVNETSEKPVKIFAYQHDIHIFNLNREQATVYVYDLMGQLLIENKINEESNTVLPMNSETSYYIVKVLIKERMSTEKVFIR
jgi:hypothetical protein